MLVKKGKTQMDCRSVADYSYRLLGPSLCITYGPSIEIFRNKKQYMLANQKTLAPREMNNRFIICPRKARNVIVFFLDRAVGAYFPYFMDDIPELASQLEGFVYYPQYRFVWAPYRC